MLSTARDDAGLWEQIRLGSGFGPQEGSAFGSKEPLVAVAGVQVCTDGMHINVNHARGMSAVNHYGGAFGLGQRSQFLYWEDDGWLNDNKTGVLEERHRDRFHQQQTNHGADVVKNTHRYIGVLGDFLTKA